MSDEKMRQKIANRKTQLTIEDDFGLRNVERFASVRPEKINLYKVGEARGGGGAGQRAIENKNSGNEYMAYAAAYDR